MQRTILLGIVALSLGTLTAQPPRLEIAPYHIGGYIGFQGNFHWAQFSQLPGVPNCCPGFQGGFGSSPVIGAVLQYPIFPDLYAQLRFGYANRSVTLIEREVIGNALSQGVVVPALSQYELSANLPSLAAELRGAYQLIADLPLYLHVGIAGGAYFNSRYSQREVLLEPKTAVYTNGKAIRNESAGEIPNHNPLFLSGLAGFTYVVPLSPTLTIQPAISYYRGFSSILRDYKWKPDALRLDIAVLFSFIQPAEPVQPEPPPPPPPTPPAMLSVAVDALAVYDDGHRDRNVKITIEEIERGEFYPLLPYVFFETNRANLADSRMHLLSSDQTQYFDENALPPSTLEIYYNLLNIVAARLKQHPDATLTITGCNNNLGKEHGNLELSRRRAEVVRNYFINVWNIDSSRLILKYRNLPEKPANNDRPEGREENRRVELSSDNPEILRPVYLQSIQRTVTPSTIEILPQIHASLPLNHWDIQVQSMDTIYAEFSGTTPPPDTLQWHLPTEFFASLADVGENTLSITLTAQDQQGNQAHAQTTIPVHLLSLQKKRYTIKNDYRYEYFSLILFDYDKADLKPIHTYILDIVKQRVQPNSKVFIEGYADRTGTPAYNRELAMRRCLSVKRYLVPTIREDQIQVRAIGSDRLLYDNDIPEGRNYCRIVRIIIATPVSEQ